MTFYIQPLKSFILEQQNEVGLLGRKYIEHPFSKMYMNTSNLQSHFSNNYACKFS